MLIVINSQNLFSLFFFADHIATKNNVLIEQFLDCDAVTFMGVLENRKGEANCMLVNCNGDCMVSEKAVATDGVVSVIISRRDTVSVKFQIDY